MRKLKMMAKRAASEVNRDVKHGESERGELLVWLSTSGTNGTGKRRGRPAGSGRKARGGQEVQATLADPDKA
jgi:hypothetical protein